MHFTSFNLNQIISTWMTLASIIGFSTTSLIANQQIQQKVIDGGTIPQFVEPLTTFNGKRADGKAALTITAKEFQQKILPKEFYKKLPKSVTYKSLDTGNSVFTINPRKGTYLWGYEIDDGKNSYGPSYPATTIRAKRNVKTEVTYKNDLVSFRDKKKGRLPGPLLQKFLTTDLSFQWANPLNWPQFGTGFDTYDPVTYPYGTGLPQGNPGIYEGPQPLVTHLHGAENPPYADGDPNSWATPGEKYTGSSFVKNSFTYHNSQPATALWFHEHSLGLVRLNVFAGLAGFYFIDGEPDTSVTPPLPHGEFEVELLVADRQFDENGQLFFPDGDPLTAGLNGPPGNPDINPYAIPEFFGDVMCVNGKSWPYFEVEPRRYFFRFLNGCNARFMALYLTSDHTSNPDVPDIWQIETDGGLLDTPVNISSFIPYTYQPSDECLPAPINLGPVFDSSRLFFAPGERMGVIIDFTGYEGTTFTVNNDAPAPFPSGGTTLDPKVEGVIMQFRVKKPLSSPDTSFNPAVPGATLRSGDQAIVRLVDGDGGLAPGVVPNLTRSLVLIEQEDPYSTAPVVVLCNNTSYNGRNPYNNKRVGDSVPYCKKSLFVTELPQVGSTEIWEIVNLTPDTHPIHIHLIQFQLMNRQPFYLGNTVPPFICAGSYRNLYENLWGLYPKRPEGVPPGTVYAYGPPLPYLSTPKLGGNPDVTPFLIGNPIPPDPNEYGWKDTIKMNPGTVTRLVVRWANQEVPVGGVAPGENTFPFDPTDKRSGTYVWHCHILDHEDNMMMRPFALRKEAQVQN